MKLKHLLLTPIILTLGACSSLKVTSDYDKEADFTKYKTFNYFGWQEDSDKILNRFDKERIEAAFRKEFEKRGITFTESGGDAIVSLFIVIDQKTQTTAYTNHYGGMYGAGYRGYGYGGWGMGMGQSTTTYNESEYLVGTLVCDVFDAETKKLVWQSVGSGTVDDNPNNREKNIPKTVAKIMYEYPIKPTE